LKRRLGRRLEELARLAAQEADPAGFGSPPAGRKARSRAAPCILHGVWAQARIAKFEYMEEIVAVTLGSIYVQRLNRGGLSAPTVFRLHRWLHTYQPQKHLELGCTPTMCLASGPGRGPENDDPERGA
jgi:hypothetical protein